MFSSLPPEVNRRAQKLYRKILYLYIGITSAVLGLSALALYTYVSDTLHRQHQEELRVLAEAATSNLEEAKTQSDYFSAQNHWHQLEQHSQSLEWFNPEGELLIREGKVFPTITLPKTLSLPRNGLVERDWEQNLYVATMPVIETGKLVGIVRASESLRVIQKPLQKLLWGLLFGGFFGLATIILSGIWFARLSMQPYIKSNQRLREFTADASHELRTPLATVQAGLDLMLEQSQRLTESDLTTLNSMGIAIAQLRQLTEALLQLARLDQAIELPQQMIPLHELLEELVEIFELLAEDNKIKLVYQPFSSVSIHGNNGQLVQLFSNLVQNAIQYTPEGGTVTVTLTQSAQEAIVKVSDTGIGIASEDIAHVCQRFWRADQARSQRQGGLGLGLAIAQNIVRQYRGTLKINSQVGQGTTVEVRIPKERG